MNKFTVVGYYEDEGQSYVEHVEAEDWSGAVVAAVKSLEKTNETPEDAAKYFRSNVVIVEVFEGHHKGLTEHPSVCSAIDFPGLGVGE
jgi:hypothetical protein